MRTSSIVTISLPSSMVKASTRAAKRHHMTRSELVRTALRRFLEEQSVLDAIHAHTSERATGKLKTLTSLKALADV